MMQQNQEMHTALFSLFERIVSISKSLSITWQIFKLHLQEFQMDNFDARQALLGAIDGALSTFEEIFSEIQPIERRDGVKANGLSESSSNSNSNSSNSSKSSIESNLLHLLTSKQYQIVHNLSLHLEKIKKSGNTLHRLYHRNNKIDNIESKFIYMFAHTYI
jgi:hypothetical protein